MARTAKYCSTSDVDVELPLTRPGFLPFFPELELELEELELELGWLELELLM